MGYQCTRRARALRLEVPHWRGVLRGRRQDPRKIPAVLGNLPHQWGANVEAAQSDGLPCTNPLALTLTGPDRSCLGRPVRALSAVRLRYGNSDAGSLAQPVIFESIVVIRHRTRAARRHAPAAFSDSLGRVHTRFHNILRGAFCASNGRSARSRWHPGEPSVGHRTGARILAAQMLGPLTATASPQFCHPRWSRQAQPRRHGGPRRAR